MKMCPNSKEPCGGPAVTVSVAAPLAPTVAIAVLLEDQLTAPAIGLPFASRSVAVSCTVAATATAAGLGVTVTEAIGVESGPAPRAPSPPQPAAARRRISSPAVDPHGCRDVNDRWKVKSMVRDPPSLREATGRRLRALLPVTS